MNYIEEKINELHKVVNEQMQDGSVFLDEYGITSFVEQALKDCQKRELDMVITEVQRMFWEPTIMEPIIKTNGKFIELHRDVMGVWREPPQIIGVIDSSASDKTINNIAYVAKTSATQVKQHYEEIINKIKKLK